MLVPEPLNADEWQVNVHLKSGKWTAGVRGSIDLCLKFVREASEHMNTLATEEE